MSGVYRECFAGGFVVGLEQQREQTVGQVFEVFVLEEHFVDSTDIDVFEIDQLLDQSALFFGDVEQVFGEHGEHGSETVEGGREHLRGAVFGVDLVLLDGAGESGLHEVFADELVVRLVLVAVDQNEQRQVVLVRDGYEVEQSFEVRDV